MLVLVLLAAAVAALTIWRLAARLRDVDRQVKELRLLRREIEELRADLDRYTGLLNLVGGMPTWPGPRLQEAAAPEPPPAPAGTTVTYRGGHLSEAQVVGAIRECFDPEIPLNIYDLGLIYGIDIDQSAIAVKMTLTSEGCPSARTIPEDVRRKIAALGQPNVTVDVVWDPPWHPSRISPDGKQKLGLG